MGLLTPDLVPVPLQHKQLLPICLFFKEKTGTHRELHSYGFSQQSIYLLIHVVFALSFTPQWFMEAMNYYLLKYLD